MGWRRRVRLVLVGRRWVLWGRVEVLLWRRGLMATLLKHYIFNFYEYDILSFVCFNKFLEKPQKPFSKRT